MTSEQAIAQLRARLHQHETADRVLYGTKTADTSTPGWVVVPAPEMREIIEALVGRQVRAA